MSSLPDLSNRQVIHVAAPDEGDGTRGMVSSISARLTAAGLDVRDIGDVYRALARIGSAGSNSPVAVVVRADDLTTAEIEFFSIVARIHPNAAVYVYGRSNADERIAMAIDMGATGELTDDVIRTLADATSSTPSTTDDDAASAPASPYPEDIEDAARGLRRDQAEGSAESTQRAAEVREPPSDPPRFPWRRYEDAPKRNPPSRSERTWSAESEGDQPDPSVPVHEPLLTEEELRALIGDDPATALSDDGAPRLDDRAADEGQAR